jgi:hypothetical protein
LLSVVNARTPSHRSEVSPAQRARRANQGADDLPHDEEAERSVLGALLLELSLSLSSLGLRPDEFYAPQHQFIAEEIDALVTVTRQRPTGLTAGEP